MLAVIICLLGILAILLVNETLWRKKLLSGELKRKFVHILAAAFIAFWPWLISWGAIQLIGLAMFVVLIANRRLRILHYLGNIRQKSYGDVFLALAVTASALLTNHKIFFALAILHVALADGLAAILGSKFGKPWSYKIFGQTKTLVGSMVFWITSIFILGIGLLAADNLIAFSDYALLLVVLPPILTAVENVGAYGLDNLALPIVAILMLQTL